MGHRLTGLFFTLLCMFAAGAFAVVLKHIIEAVCNSARCGTCRRWRWNDEVIWNGYPCRSCRADGCTTERLKEKIK